MNVSFLLPLFHVCSLVTAMFFLLPSDVHAEFYKYKDASGSLVITNKLENVPKKYRKSVKVVWDEELTAKDPLARRMAAAEARHGQRQSQQEKQDKQQEKQGRAGTKSPSDGKTLVITYDEATGQLIRTME